MSDLVSFVHAMRRPSLLIRAALHGARDYNRDRVLKRLTPNQTLACPRSAVTSLLSSEATLEAARLTGDASYNVSRHVEVLIALLAEVRLLSKPRLPA